MNYVVNMSLLSDESLHLQQKLDWAQLDRYVECYYFKLFPCSMCGITESSVTEFLPQYWNVT